MHRNPPMEQAYDNPSYDYDPHDDLCDGAISSRMAQTIDNLTYCSGEQKNLGDEEDFKTPAAILRRPPMSVVQNSLRNNGEVKRLSQSEHQLHNQNTRLTVNPARSCANLSVNTANNEINVISSARDSRPGAGSDGYTGNRGHLSGAEGTTAPTRTVLLRSKSQETVYAERRNELRRSASIGQINFQTFTSSDIEV